MYLNALCTEMQIFLLLYRVSELIILMHPEVETKICSITPMHMSVAQITFSELLNIHNAPEIAHFMV